MYDGVFQILTTQNIKKHNLFFDDIEISNIDYKRENEIEKVSKCGSCCNFLCNKITMRSLCKSLCSCFTIAG